MFLVPAFKLVQQLLTAKRDLPPKERSHELDQFDAVIRLKKPAKNPN